jgi:hypothetical protein
MAATIRYLEHMMPAGQYVGWLAMPSAMPETIVAGAGVLLRGFRRTGTIPPEAPSLQMADKASYSMSSRSALGVSAVASLLMQRVLDWAANSGLETLVLHASDDGRRLHSDSAS